MKDPRKLLDDLKSAFGNNEKEKLESLISYAPFIHIKDPLFHKEVAQILYALGRDELSKKEYELSIRDGIEDYNVYITLAEIYMENGEYQKAVNLLRRGIEIFPTEEDLYIKLGEFYKARGELGAVELLFKLAYENTNNPYFKRKSIDLYEEEGETFKPQNIHIAKFLSLFRGREGVYARQWVDSKGNTGYSPIREPFTLKVAKNHLMGNYTIGLYQLREDNTVEFLVFDIDVSKKFLKDYFSSEKIHDEIERIFKRMVSDIVSFLKENQIKAYVEDSGFKGYHIWVFLDKPLSAALGRTFGMYVLQKLKIEEDMVYIEIFPKQMFLKGKDRLGNLIKLPLGIHRRSGKRSLFLNDELLPPKDQLSFLLEIEKTEKDRVVELCDVLKDELPPLDFVKQPPKDIEKEKEFVIEDDREFNILIRRCPVIGVLWDKVRAGAGLNSDESMVIVFTLGHLTNGPKVVNSILRRAGIFDEKSYLKSKLRGYPMGCPKIRKKIPYITLNTCKDCFSGEDLGTYPNPLLHLREFEKEDKDIEVVILEYVDILKKYEILKSRIDKVKDVILSYMEERGLDVLESENIVLEKSEDGNSLCIRARGDSDQKT